MPRRIATSRGSSRSTATTAELLARLSEKRKGLDSFRARANGRRSKTERLVDDLTTGIGSIPFLIFHVGLFAVWIGMNIVPSHSAFDPFPFGLLTMILTLEQAFLTIFIIMSQNRSANIADLRNEIDLQINIIAEDEITKVLKMLRLIGTRLEISEIINDKELEMMVLQLDTAEIEKQTRQELAESMVPVGVTETPQVKPAS
jgi:uncharacterized membrane protein